MIWHDEVPADSPQRQLFEISEYDSFCYVTTEALTPWQAHKKHGERATCETWIEETKGQMGMGHLRTDRFLANAALFYCAVLAYNTLRWMALLSGGNRQLTVKTPANLLYPQAWADWVAVGMVT